MDIKDYIIEHEEKIVDDFINNYSTEFEEYFKDIPHDSRSLHDESNWALEHPSFHRFCELHYANYYSD